MARRMAVTLVEHPRTALAGFVTDSPERSAALKAEFSVPVSTDLASLDADVVYVASVSTRHAADVAKALGLGLPTLCEKPLGVDPQEVAALQTEARTQAVFLMEAMWSRFLPVGRELASRLERGDYKEARTVTSALGYPVDRDPARRWFGDAGSGGALLDLGIYGLDVALQVLGPPVNTSVDAELEGEVVTQATIRGTHSNGARSITFVTFESLLAGDLTISCPQLSDTYRGEFQPAFAVERMTPTGTSVVDLTYESEGLAPEVDEVHRHLDRGSLESDLLPHAATAALHTWLGQIRDQIKP